MQSKKAHAQALLVAAWSMGIPAHAAVATAVADTGLSRKEVTAIGYLIPVEGLEPEAEEALEVLRRIGIPIKDPSVRA